MKLKLPFYKHLFTGVVLLFSVTVRAQLAGRIINEQNEGIPNASIQVKGRDIGTTADNTGVFTLNDIPKIPFTVTVSSVNYDPRNIVVRNSGDSLIVKLALTYHLDTIVVTSRRRNELLQEVPIAVSVIGGAKIAEAGAFNVNRIKEMVPSLQLYTSNPRNTGVNIRGLGSPFGLTNDGLDPGVGFYIDGVYYARPAAAVLDFIDVDRIEVLRGPQGTLFGKNTAAGAISIISKKPSFYPGGTIETSFGNYGYIQAKASITGPLTSRIAGRLSFSGTQRDGLIYNTRTQQHVNDINNLGFRAQLLYNVSDNTTVSLSGDVSSQKPVGYAQVIAGVVKTERPDYRQFDAIIADLNYKLPSLNAFDRIIDHDTPWKSDNELGGVSLNIDSKIGPGTLTSTTAWRYWNWNPSNDRDFTGLEALSKSQNPAEHKNFSQEFRYAGNINDRLSGVVGLFFIDQDIKIHGTEESGKDQWRFAQSTTSDLWKTPGLLDGYGIKTESSIKSLSAAAFANVDWEFINHFHFLPGIRLNYDEKNAVYDRKAYGGLQTDDPALLALKNSVYSSQFYQSNVAERNFTYQLTLAYKPSKRINSFATYSTSFKPVGVNVAGIPTVDGKPATDLAVIRPEYTKHAELGIKTNPTNDLTLNLTFHNSDIKDYQTNVQSPELGVNRGYIANADKVNVKGIEFDGSYRANTHFNFNGSFAYTDGKYVKFTNAPLPLEETGHTENGVQVAFKDISGSRLPGISKWAGSLGGEYSTAAALFGKPGQFFIALDGFYRSAFSSSPTPSKYLNIDGYTLFNGRLGFRATKGLTAFIWGRNILNKDYYEQLLVAGGNSGQYAAVLGDQRTYGITLSYTFNSKN